MTEDRTKRTDVSLIVALVVLTGIATWAINVYLDASDEARSYMRMAAAGGVSAVIALAIALLIYIKLRPVGKRADRK